MSTEDPTPRRRVTDHVPPHQETVEIPVVSETAENTARDLKRSLRVLGVMTVVLYLVIACLGLWVWSQSNRNTNALCDLRHNIEERNGTAEEFLRTHPKGIPGVSAESLEINIRTSRQTLKALSDLDC